MTGLVRTARTRAMLCLALGLLASSCIDNMSVGVSPLATVDASVAAPQDASTGNSAGRDAGERIDSGSPPSEPHLVDAAVRDAAVQDATVRDATVRDAESDATADAARDASSATEAGLERCDERFCQIAGLVPVDDSCPKGQASACLRETSGQCVWYCL